MKKFPFPQFVYLCIGVFVYWIIPMTQVLAAGEFRADYDIQYTVAPNGLTTVTSVITLTNKLTSLYPKQYTVLIDSKKISNVIAYDGAGPISPSVKHEDEKTEITVAFHEQSVGIGNSTRFTLRYDNEDIAQKVGSVWELYIPGIAEDPDIGSYNVSLYVPPSFGPNAYISPLPAGKSHWTREQMISGGVSAAYGTNQQFRFTLAYYLKNPTLQKGEMTIVLPPDTRFQTVEILTLEPRPDSVHRSEDDNWVATYTLQPGQEVDIKAELRIRVYTESRTDYTSNPTVSERLLSEQKYWESASPSIREIVSRIKTPREIYDYVVSTLSYDYRRVSLGTERIGALRALESPKAAICTEFTDLFIALSRASGIPARRAIGYAYTTNPRLRPLSLVTDVLHTWPEYYDREKKVWVPVDPTWADTTGGVDYFNKLDFNHVVFAYNGTESDLPYPAGFYRNPAKNGKDIQAAFDTSDPVPSKNHDISLEIQFPQHIPAGFRVPGQVKIINISGVTQKNLKLHARSSINGEIITQELEDLLPYGTIRIPFQDGSSSYSAHGQHIIVVSAGDATERVTYRIYPVILFLAGICGLVAAIVFLLYVVLWRGRIWKHSKKH